MDQASFIEICVHQLKMSGVKSDEKLIVLTQGSAIAPFIYTVF